MLPTRRARHGFTIFELLVVLALLVIIGAIVLPSTTTLFGSTRPRAAADQIRGELAAAKAWAMEDGQPYRVALSPDGTRIRRAAEAEFDQPASSQPAASARRVEYTFDKTLARVASAGQAGSPPADATGWVTVAVFLPNGTCRTEGEGSGVTTVAIHEEGHAENAAGLRVIVRGVTGQVRVVTGGAQK